MSGLLFGWYFTFSCYKFSKDSAQDVMTGIFLATATLFFVVGIVHQACNMGFDAAKTLWCALVSFFVCVGGWVAAREGALGCVFYVLSVALQEAAAGGTATPSPCTLQTPETNPPTHQPTRRGSTAVGVLAIYYVAPLTTMLKVLRQRDSASLNGPLSTMNVINGALWFAYGLAIKDYFIALPNGTGAALNVLCVLLCELGFVWG